MNNLANYNEVLRKWAARPESGARTEEWLDQMRAAGVEPTLQSYNHTFKAWARQGEAKAVEALMEKMQQRGIEPNNISYTNLVMAHTTRGDLDDAMKVVERMRAAGVLPNYITYTLLVDASGKKGDMQLVESLLAELDAGVSVDATLPAAAPYSSAMSHYLKRGDFEASANMWDRLRSLKLKPDVAAYAVFFHLCCVRGNIRPAEEAFKEMTDSNIRANGYCFAAFLNFYAKENSVVDCEAWWQKMEDMRCRPTTSCYNSMIQVFSKAGVTETAELWMQRVENTRDGPNAHSFGTLMDAYARRGRHPECLELMQRMRSRGLAPNRVHHNTLIKAYVSGDDLEAADRYLAEMGPMEKRQQPDSFTYTTIIFGYLKRRRNVQRADELLDQMRAAGMEPDDNVAGALQTAREVAMRGEQQDAAAAAPAAEPAAAAAAAPTAAAAPGIDWVEELAADGGRTFMRPATGERSAQEPRSGVVQLTSEHGPYYWHVESGTTSWEAPGVAANWPPQAAA